MIEYIPVSVDFLKASVGVVSEVGGGEGASVLVENHAAGIHEHTTAAPWSERGVTVCITERGVGTAESVIRSGIS